MLGGKKNNALKIYGVIRNQKKKKISTEIKQGTEEEKA